MNRILTAFWVSAVLAQACVAAQPAIGTNTIKRVSGPNSGGPAFVSDNLGGGCTIGIEFVPSTSSPLQMIFFRKVPECDRQFPGKAQVAATTRDLLAAASEYGQNLHLIATVDPTAVLQRDWVQNYIDCDIGQSDPLDVAAPAGQLEHCDIVPELREPFAAYGVALRFARGTEPFGFECENLDGYRSYLDPVWLAKYRGRHCRRNIPTHWWFHASPL